MQKNSSKFLRLTAVCAALTLALGTLAGCSTPSNSGDGSKSPNSTSSPKSSITSTAGDIVRGGEFVQSITGLSGDFFNPYKQGTLTTVGWPCYEPLAYYQEDNEWHSVLAESWEVDNEAYTLTVKIKKNITFHNGDTLDANDVLFSHASRKEYGTQSVIGNPSAIEAIDDYTVKFTWDEFSLNYENWILSQYIYSKETFEEKGLDWMLNNMVGTGPYKMTSFVPDAELVFERNDSYWQEETPAPDSFKWVVMPDVTTQVAAFLSGEIDLLMTSDPVALPQLEAAGFVGEEAAFRNDNQTMAIPISLDENHPLSKPEVRKAIFNHGVNWGSLATTIGGELGYHTDTIGFSGMSYYKDALEKSSYDVEKAKKLLSDAGYPDGFKTTIYTPNMPITTQAAAYLQAELAKIGITTDVEAVDYGVIQGEYLGGKAVKSGIAIWMLQFPAANQTDRFTKHINPTATLGGSSAWSDEIKTLWDKVSTAKTQEDQDKYMYDYVNYYVHEGSYMWPMYNVIGQLMFTQEWSHITELSEVLISGRNPFGYWADKK